MSQHLLLVVKTQVTMKLFSSKNMENPLRNQQLILIESIMMMLLILICPKLFWNSVLKLLHLTQDGSTMTMHLDPLEFPAKLSAELNLK